MQQITTVGIMFAEQVQDGIHNYKLTDIPLSKESKYIFIHFNSIIITAA